MQNTLSDLRWMDLDWNDITTVRISDCRNKAFLQNLQVRIQLSSRRKKKEQLQNVYLHNQLFMP